MPERRRSPRFPVDNVNGQLRVTSTARLRSLSAREVVLETAHQTRVLRGYVMTFHMGDDTTIRAHGTVSACRLAALRTAGGESLPVYETVVRIAAPVPRRIAELIAGNGEAESAVPFDVLEARGMKSTVHLDTSQDFSVKNISLHGALIETERPLATGARLDTELHPGASSLATQARIVFSRQTESDGRVAFQLGIEFLATPEKDLEALEEFLMQQPLSDALP